MVDISGDSDRDHDWFVFTLTDPGRIRIYADASEEDFPPNERLYYNLYPEGESAHWIGFSGGAADVLRDLAAGTYELEIRADVGREGPYALHVEFETAAIDYDTDRDGLLEVRTFAQLDAIRYDPEGCGVALPGHESAYAAAFPRWRGSDEYGALTCGGRLPWL